MQDFVWPPVLSRPANGLDAAVAVLTFSGGPWLLIRGRFLLWDAEQTSSHSAKLPPRRSSFVWRVLHHLTRPKRKSPSAPCGCI